MKLIRDKTKSKSIFYWDCHAKIEMKKERFLSMRQFSKYWEEKPELKCRALREEEYYVNIWGEDGN